MHEEKRERGDNIEYDDTEITFCSAIFHFLFKRYSVARGMKSQPADYVN